MTQLIPDRSVEQMANRRTHHRSTPYLLQQPPLRHRPTDRVGYAVKISHLPQCCSQKDVEFVFARFGRIDSCKLVPVAGEESYALVNYADYTSATDAVQTMDTSRRVFRDQTKPLRVVIKENTSGPETRPQPSPSQHTIKVLHLPHGTSDEQLMSVCRQFGAVSVKINQCVDTYAYVNFTDFRQAENALRYFDRDMCRHFGPRATAKHHQHVQQPPPARCPSPSTSSHSHSAVSGGTCMAPSRTVKVSIHKQNSGITPEDLLGIFSRYGTITPSPRINSGTPDYAYINFSTQSSAATACEKPSLTFRGVHLSVKLSTKPSTIETDTMEVSSPDALVNVLLTSAPFLDTAKALVQQHGITVSVKPAGSLKLFGSSDSLQQAKMQINSVIDKIKQAIISEEVLLPCYNIPAFVINANVFQEIEKKRLVELAVVNIKEKRSIDLVTFSTTVAGQLGVLPQCAVAKTTGLHTVDDFRQFFSQSGSNVSWLYKDNSQRMVEFDPKSAKQLEDQYLNNHGGHLTFNKWTYTYDFVNMKQTNIITNRVREIARRAPAETDYSFTVVCRGEKLKVLAAIKDLKQVLKRETVQMDISLEESTQEMKDLVLRLASRYLVKVREVDSFSKIIIEGCPSYVERIKLVLKERLLDMIMKAQKAQNPAPVVAQSTKPSIPPHWEPQVKKCELKQVEKGTKEWCLVESNVGETIQNPQILKIERIQNIWLWERYAFCKERMLEKNNGNISEKQLFHGTRETPPDQVYGSEHGFDFRYGGNGMWGKGAYFAVNASYSSNGYAHTLPDRSRQILLAFVLTGDSVEVSSGANSLSKPPAKPRGSGTLINELYDSVNGWTGGTKIYVVYDHDKAYPAYLITFKPNTSYNFR